MKFDQVYDLLLKYQAERNQRLVLLSGDTLREVYGGIVATRARDCLELGTGFGATTCVMAAAIDEIGGGTVMTVDQIAREPVGVNELAQLTGLSQYVTSVLHGGGYNWILLRMLREQARARECEPRFDFCFLDGAHEWEPDGLAALLVPRLLRPGAWMMVDDLNFKLRGCHPGWERAYGHKSAEELDTRQVGMVYELLVRTHPDLEHFMLSNSGHIGWARKTGGEPASWFPDGVFCGAIAASWSETRDGIALEWDAPPNADGIAIEQQGGAVLMSSTTADPFVVFKNPLETPREIDFVTLRVKLLTPDLETLQLFWIGGDQENFNEGRSMRCSVQSSGKSQDLTFCIRGSGHARTIGLFRLDPADGPCVMLLESVTVGGR
jgi:predicted O-methyltransferase YrrM